MIQCCNMHSMVFLFIRPNAMHITVKVILLFFNGSVFSICDSVLLLIKSNATTYIADLDHQEPISSWNIYESLKVKLTFTNILHTEKNQDEFQNTVTTAFKFRNYMMKKMFQMLRWLTFYTILEKLTLMWEILF